MQILTWRRVGRHKNRRPLTNLESPVHQPGLALLVIGVALAAKSPLAHSQKLRRLRWFSSADSCGRECSKTSQCAHPEGLPSGDPTPPEKGQTYPTDRALSKPNLSSATDSQHDYPFRFPESMLGCLLPIRRGRSGGEFNEAGMGELMDHIQGRRARLKPVNRDGDGDGSEAAGSGLV
jgi:hypothetical protein